MEAVKKKMASLRKEAEEALQRAERSEDELRETLQLEEEVMIIIYILLCTTFFCLFVAFGLCVGKWFSKLIILHLL